LISAAAMFVFASCAVPTIKQTGENAEAQVPLKGYSFHARLAYFSATGDRLLVTLCETDEGFCRPWRYKIAERMWEKVFIKGMMPRWSFGSASYSPDGKTIALEFSICDRKPNGATCPLKDVKIALLDVASGELTALQLME
jgi:hypothetical protein